MKIIIVMCLVYCFLAFIPVVGLIRNFILRKPTDNFEVRSRIFTTLGILIVYFSFYFGRVLHFTFYQIDLPLIQRGVIIIFVGTTVCDFLTTFLKKDFIHVETAFLLLFSLLCSARALVLLASILTLVNLTRYIIITIKSNK